jgi:hypothetical protein
MSAHTAEFAGPREPAIGISAEKLRVNERAEHPLAFPLAQMPETLRLR